MATNPETTRLQEIRAANAPWRKWGPYADHPCIFFVNGQEYRVNYLPAESDTGMFGGNSNWRGPIWMPVNALLIRALLSFYYYYGDNFKIECPTGSGNSMNLFEVAHEISNRLIRTSCEIRMVSDRSLAALRNSRTIQSGKTTYCSTSSSTVITGQDWVRATRPAGPAWLAS